MITKNLNQKMVVSKTALLKKAEREYLESFYSFKLSHDSDKTLMKDSRKNVLAIIEKSKGSAIAINVDNDAVNFYLTPKCRNTVNYKNVIETIKSMGVIANSTLDELLIGNTTITSYDELTIKGEE
tara:strand:- start:220 stop:597 length:378 start_codon:yes stop_codon:yes gene_type:complete